MAHGRGMSDVGPPQGEESDHIGAERARLKAGAQKHFAQRAGGSAEATCRSEGGRRGAQAGDVGKRMPAEMEGDEED